MSREQQSEWKKMFGSGAFRQSEPKGLFQGLLLHTFASLFETPTTSNMTVTIYLLENEGEHKSRLYKQMCLGRREQTRKYAKENFTIHLSYEWKTENLSPRLNWTCQRIDILLNQTEKQVNWLRMRGGQLWKVKTSPNLSNWLLFQHRRSPEHGCITPLMH